MNINEQAIEYIYKFGLDEAKKSTHYFTGKHCKCGQCFCCAVKKYVDKETARKNSPCNDKREK